ncbi:TPA: hypothetical protein ONC52_001976 [Enterobacter asburiae]|nr:hypothetical protein [Enterobacter asburiae]HCR2223681.1 hypothetical protein [Enterobacter asburiae]HDX3905836.1 hypothetical protein [Enterobacter asburiae]
MVTKPTSTGYHFSLALPGHTQSGEFHDEPKNADYQSHWVEQVFSALDEGFLPANDHESYSETGNEPIQRC